MKSRQTDWPRQWLMTDERIGDRLWTAIDRLTGTYSGIVFRHYATPSDIRAVLAHRVADICHRRGFTLAIADEELARSLRAHLVHNPHEMPADLPFSRSVHSMKEAEAARNDGASLVFVSSVYPTRSHPGQTALGEPLALRIAHRAGAPAIALGGMTELNSRELIRDGFYGWAGIDAWLTGERA
jgi:thiamine monophosphate synthase